MNRIIPAMGFGPKQITVEKPMPLPKVYTEKGAKLAAKLKGKIYRTTNYLAMIDKDVTPDGVSKAILQAAIDFEKKYTGKWRGRHYPRPADLERYMLWLYATASRENEPFLKPYPQIEVFRPRKLPWQIVKVKRQIEKSFEPGTRTHTWIEQYIPIFDATEREIWRKILNDFDENNLDDLFDRIRKHLGKKKNTRNLTHIIQHNFKADQKVSRGSEKGKLFKGAPITPHLLRHHRVYNWKIERRLQDSTIVLLVGWKDESMLSYYAYMNERIKGEAQLQELERYAKDQKGS